MKEQLIKKCIVCGEEFETCKANAKCCSKCRKPYHDEYKHDWYEKHKPPMSPIGHRLEDLTGKQFNRLTAIEYVGTNKYKNALYRCKCSCGNECIVRGTALKNGKTKSCGCLQREKSKENIERYNASEEYIPPIHKTHGLRHTELYQRWCNIKQRATNHTRDHHERYVDKGVTICDEWKNDFKAFYDWAISHGYRDDLEIDRIDVDGDYCPENCRWVTRKVQARNKSNTLYYEHDGVKKPFIEWCELLGLKYKAAHARYRKGESMDSIFVPKMAENAFYLKMVQEALE